ncbi:MAG: TIGR03089 family protein [Pseudonocardiaceae bacterium]|nr:TIGR03089 family protein [Pseudonocardiaceae bacterium]
MTVTEALLGPLLREDAARPRITHYDDATGGRVELSGATLANWAAKTANWLRDELDVAPGDGVAVLLPAHWQTAGVLLGAWWCGGVVTPEADGAEVALCGVERVADAEGAGELAAVSLDALGAGVPVLPPGVRDYASEVRGHGDEFAAAPLPDTAPATPDATVEQLVDAARRRATELGLGPEDRVLCTDSWSWDPGPLLTVLAAGASLVQCTGTDPAANPAALQRRCDQERVTVALGSDLPPLDGVRPLR